MSSKTPNFFVIGAMKSATTSLYTYLCQHPEIFMTKVKEPMFFNNYRQNNHYHIIGKTDRKNTDFDEYISLFSAVNDEIAIGEASPSYMYNEKAPSLIKEKFPNTKIISILRHPTDRAYSNFLHVKRAGRETEDNFQRSIEIEGDRINNNWSPLYHYINQGYYSNQLKRYFDIFPKENIKVYLFEDLVTRPQKTLRDILHFLEVKEDIVLDLSKKSNVSGVPRGLIGWVIKKMRFYNLMPRFTLSKYLPSFIINLIFRLVYKKSDKLDKDLRSYITKKYYADEIKKLQRVINRDLSHWLS